jgi:hypothetical protein
MSARTMTLESPLLRLVKERNEARELCKRLFYVLPTEGGARDEEAINAAYYHYLEASRRWKGAKS